MKVNHFRNLVLVPWLSLPVVLTGYLLFWNKISSKIAVHFTSSGNPVTLMSREQSLLFDLITLLVVLSVYSWRLWKRHNNLERILVRYYFAIVTITVIFLGILHGNI